MKLFIEYILDEIEQIGLNHQFRVSLSSTKNEHNYLRGFLQFFDRDFNIHFVIFFSFPEEHPKLQYTFWILDQAGNRTVVEKDGSEEKMMDVVKETAIKEINVNIMEGGEVRHLLTEIEKTIRFSPVFP
jgi:hypothetical protein